MGEKRRRRWLVTVSRGWSPTPSEQSDRYTVSTQRYVEADRVEFHAGGQVALWLRPESDATDDLGRKLYPERLVMAFREWVTVEEVREPSPEQTREMGS